MDFSKEISDFQKNGTYVYRFDEGWNLVFNTSSADFNQHYVSIPLENYKYDNTKIKSFYDLSFKEFVPTTTETTVETVVSQDVANLQAENEALQGKLTALTVLADANQTPSQILATKQVIIGLRIQLNQGSSEIDFSTEFPYLPNTKNST